MIPGQIASYRIREYLIENQGYKTKRIRASVQGISPVSRRWGYHVDKNVHRKKGGNGHASDFSKCFVLADKLDQGFGRHLFGNPFLATFTGTVPPIDDNGKSWWLPYSKGVTGMIAVHSEPAVGIENRFQRRRSEDGIAPCLQILF